MEVRRCQITVRGFVGVCTPKKTLCAGVINTVDLADSVQAGDFAPLGWSLPFRFSTSRSGIPNTLTKTLLICPTSKGRS